MFRLVIIGVCLFVLAIIGIVLVVFSLQEKAKDKKTLKQLQSLMVQDAENHRLSLSDTFVYPMGGFYVALDKPNRKMIYRLLPNEEKALAFSDVISFSMRDRVEEWEKLVHQLSQDSSRSGVGSVVTSLLIDDMMAAGTVAAMKHSAQKPVSEMTSQEIEAQLKDQSFLTVQLHLTNGETVTFPMMVHGAHSWEKKYRELAQDNYKTYYILLKSCFTYGSTQA